MSAELLKDSSGEFQLTGYIDFRSVPQLVQQTNTLFVDNQDVTVNLSGVEQSNSAGLALLIHWLRAAQERQGRIKFKNIPSQLLEIAKISGVEHLFVLNES